MRNLSFTNAQDTHTSGPPACTFPNSLSQSFDHLSDVLLPRRKANFRFHRLENDHRFIHGLDYLFAVSSFYHIHIHYASIKFSGPFGPCTQDNMYCGAVEYDDCRSGIAAIGEVDFETTSSRVK
jgi:hypothetical protein